MLLAPSPDGERFGDPGLPSGPYPARETDCVGLIQLTSQALRRTGHSALHDIRESIRDSVVFLEGRVASYYLKQLAQEAIRQAFPTALLCNELKVGA